MSERVQLRPWQRDAFEKFIASEQTDFLAVATPGAGKTTFALTCARWVLGESPPPGRQRPRLVIVAPTSHLKLQWAKAAHRLGLQVDHTWSPNDPPADDVHGLVTTYQQVAMPGTAKVLSRLADGALVILDEVHHAGDDRAWGDNIRTAFGPARRRLSLSGTPFRSDSASIPFVNYAETGQGGEAQPDFTYGYADALADGGVVRPVYFPRFDGLMEWSAPDGTLISANFHDELDRSGSAHRLRTALSLDGDWLLTVLRQANDRLQQIRAVHPQAGGLVIAIDQDHARGIAQIIRHQFGVPVHVVVSDDPQASAKIAEFAAGTMPWLVAVPSAALAAVLPKIALRDRAARRRHAILRQLPHDLDLITVSIE
ncbi:MAG TPA: DEAD/DEAH box helicase family protein, partial [Ilumatobacteraceae bacterium]|nr:DEAD/DEAH box helicase family protein [Ilumatobacteraceae bacterium]